MRTARQRHALKIAAAVLHPDELARGEATRRDTFGSVRDIAADACGMVHREGHLLLPLSHEIVLRNRHALADDLPCLIRDLE